MKTRFSGFENAVRVDRPIVRIGVGEGSECNTYESCRTSDLLVLWNKQRGSWDMELAWDPALQPASLATRSGGAEEHADEDRGNAGPLHQYYALM